MCINAFSEFQSVVDKYKNNDEVVFLAVNTSRNGDSIDKVRRFVEKYRYKFPIAYDNGAKVSDEFEVEFLPTLLIIDRGGNLRLRHIGYSKKLENYSELLTRHVDELIKQ